MFAFTAATAFAVLATIASAAPSNGIWNLPSAKATVYYDLTNSLCGNNNPFTNNWAETSGINGGIPSCESWAGASAKSLSQLGTNRIVAMDVTKVSGDLAEWCGKEVVIFDESGKQFQFSEGPLYIWDSCAAAASESIVDLSAKAFTELKGGSCGGNNPTGLTVQVLNNNVVAAIQREGGSSKPAAKLNAAIPSAATADLTADKPATTAAKATTAAAAKSTATAATAPAAASPSASTDDSDDTDTDISSSSSNDSDSTPAAAASPSASTGSCTYGAWQCNGKNIEVCNYVTTTSTAWVVSGQCPNKCSITGTSVVCA